MISLVGGPLDGLDLTHVSIDRDELVVSPDAFATVETDTLREIGRVPARKAIYRRRRPGLDLFDFQRYEES